MSVTSRIKIAGDIGGSPINATFTLENDGAEVRNVAIPAGTAGTLSTRTSDTAGTFTGAGHGLTGGEKIDIFWTGGRAYGATVGVVAGNDVPFTGAAGNVMPAEDTAITICVQTEVELDIDGDAVTAFTAELSARGRLALVDSGLDAKIIDLVADEPVPWFTELGSTGPTAGLAIELMKVSQAGTSAATFKFGALFDSTP